MPRFFMRSTAHAFLPFAAFAAAQSQGERAAAPVASPLSRHINHVSIVMEVIGNQQISIQVRCVSC